MQVSVWKEVVISRFGISKKEVAAQCCCLSGAKETPDSCGHHPDLPSACEESLFTPLVNVWVSGESQEGEVMLQRDLQRYMVDVGRARGC